MKNSRPNGTGTLDVNGKYYRGNRGQIGNTIIKMYIMCFLLHLCYNLLTLGNSFSRIHRLILILLSIGGILVPRTLY